jgi:hypothetical protein
MERNFLNGNREDFAEPSQQQIRGKRRLRPQRRMGRES